MQYDYDHFAADNDKICEQTCDEHEVSYEATEKRRLLLPNSLALDSLTLFFKALGDGTRLSILLCIDNEPMCVCDIAETLKISKYAVSHQLSALRSFNLVKYKREGKRIFYSLADDHVSDIVEKALDHIME